jgi:hypothetical protein
LKVLLRDGESNLFLYFSDGRAFYGLAGFDLSAKAVVFAGAKPGFLEAEEDLSGRMSAHEQAEGYVYHGGRKQA